MTATPRVSAAVLIDLRDLDPNRARLRFGLHAVPDNARVVVVVGSLFVNVPVIDVMRREGNRIRWEIQGEPYAVQQWCDALRAASPLDAVGVFLG